VRCTLALLVCVCLLAPGTGTASAADRFVLADGDRVVLLGNALIEREQRYGYWETALTSRYPDRSIVFRNLGWSGDTVFGEARAGFGSVAEGFQHLKEEVTAARPTVIIVGYGLNESFAGEAGLSHFRDGLGTLLDALSGTKARVVLLAPPRMEDRGRPLPDPTAANRNVRLYADAIGDTAGKRGLPLVDLYGLIGEVSSPAAPLTDDGLHLTAWGYWRTAPALERGLGLSELPWHIDLGAGSKNPTAQGAKVEAVESPRNATLRFRVTDATLPPPPAPADGSPAAPVHHKRVQRLTELGDGKYTLFVDGKAVSTASAAEWAAGVQIDRGPEFDQAEALRQAIIAKNRLYFHRWRPENETYLFGFRKQEQGKNAKEVPEFEPLVAKAEAEIARLHVPISHEYKLIPEREKGQ
jgi:lysophospholipase L1-like esterase